MELSFVCACVLAPGGRRIPGTLLVQKGRMCHGGRFAEETVLACGDLDAVHLLVAFGEEEAALAILSVSVLQLQYFL